MSRVFRFGRLALTLSLGIAVAAGGPLPPSRNNWTRAGDMTAARSGACAALLEDGRVLITGGEGSAGILASAEVLGASGRFSPAAPMAFARAAHACATLPDGRVLVAGGRTAGGGVTNAAELYDPSTNSWSMAPPMVSARTGATASVLHDGRLLIAGGESSGEAIPTLEIYDPASGRFLAVARTLSSPRKDHAAAVLKDGRVLIAGGSNGAKPLDTADIFDPATGEVSPAGKMTNPRAGLTATTLLDGRVFLAGGYNGTADLASTEIFDPASGRFLAAAPMETARRGQVAFRVPNNNSVMILGGTSAGKPTAAAGLYIPWTNSYRPRALLLMGRSAAVAVPMKDNGEVVIAGGLTPEATATPAVEVTSLPTIMTDKPDYSPGETVVITGANWTPGATVTVKVTNVADNSVRWGPTDVTADSGGNVTARFGVTEADLGQTFALTATEAGSGKTAQVWTFTDAQPVRNYSASIVPTTDTAGHATSYALTIRNGESTQDLGSANVTVPADYTAVTLGGATAPLGKTWTASLISGVIRLRSGANANRLGAGESVTVTVSATAPCSAAAYTWNTVARQSTDFSGSDNFTLTGPAPSVVVTGSCDATPPSITPNVSGPSGLNGWYTGNVTVTWTVSDPESSVTTSGCGSTTISTDTAGTTLTCSATSAGGTASASVTIKRDATPPSVTANPERPADKNGWYNHALTVSFSGTDTSSGIASCDAAQTYSGPDATSATVSGSCTDAAGNAAQATLTFKFDATAPTATTSASPGANANGWNKENVTVSFSGTDGVSGLDSCSAPVVLSSEGAGQSASGTCTDKAGNTSAPAVASNINIDKTAPTLNFTGSSPAANAAGWNNTNVSVAFDTADGLSGVASTNPAASPLVLTAEGGTVSGTVTVTDKAGNTATFTSGAFKIDKTAPTLTYSLSEVPNPAGWSKTDVTVTFACSDLLSGVATGPLASKTLGEGAGQFVSTSCIDSAGNSTAAQAGPINIDKTPPVISNVTANPVPLGTAATVTASITALPPAGSKVVSATFSIDGGTPVPMSGELPGETVTVSGTTAVYTAVGVHEVCVGATDIAGNDGEPACALLAACDQSAGFVTGGGWIVSPAGAYTANPSLSGKANFGFVSKYQRGQSTPDGNTEFQFQAAKFNFHSTSYDWLVIAGPKAQYKGSGTVNGSGDYGFLLTAIDGSINGGGGVDKFRIKVWDKTSGDVIYDNQMGQSDTGDASTAISGGSIVIHTK